MKDVKFIFPTNKMIWVLTCLVSFALAQYVPYSSSLSVTYERDQGSTLATCLNASLVISGAYNSTLIWQKQQENNSYGLIQTLPGWYGLGISQDCQRLVIGNFNRVQDYQWNQSSFILKTEWNESIAYRIGSLDLQSNTLAIIWESINNTDQMVTINLHRWIHYKIEFELNTIKCSGDGQTIAISVLSMLQKAEHPEQVWIFRNHEFKYKLIPKETNGLKVGFGINMALSWNGEWLITSGPFDDDNRGSIWTFQNDTQMGPKWNAPCFENMCFQPLQGYSLSFVEPILVFGSPYDNASGTVWVYEYAHGLWNLQQWITFKSSSTFGTSVALTNDTNWLVIGDSEFNNVQGQIVVFSRLE